MILELAIGAGLAGALVRRWALRERILMAAPPVTPESAANALDALANAKREEARYTNDSSTAQQAVDYTVQSVAMRNAANPAAKKHTNRKIYYPWPDWLFGGSPDGDEARWALVRWDDNCWEIWEIPSRDATWEGAGLHVSGGIIYIRWRGTNAQTRGSTTDVQALYLRAEDAGLCTRTTLP